MPSQVIANVPVTNPVDISTPDCVVISISPLAVFCVLVCGAVATPVVIRLVWISCAVVTGTVGSIV